MTMRIRKQQTACSRTSERLTKSCKTRRRGAGTIRELTWKSCKAEGVAVAIWTPMIYSRCSSLVAVVPSVDTVAMDTVLVVKPFRLALVVEEVPTEENTVLVIDEYVCSLITYSCILALSKH